MPKICFGYLLGLNFLTDFFISLENVTKNQRKCLWRIIQNCDKTLRKVAFRVWNFNEGILPILNTKTKLNLIEAELHPLSTFDLFLISYYRNNLKNEII